MKKVQFIKEKSSSIVSSDSKEKDVTPKKSAFGMFLDFKKLDEDFLLPNDDWERVKQVGQGAYGKVMECKYLP